MSMHKLKSGREVELKMSDDGSHTLFVPELNEHYHSVYGARTESMHVFIKSGFNQIEKSNISILEVGFGTGLNVLLTNINKGDKAITYHSIEKYPLNTQLEEMLLFMSNQKREDTLLYKKIHDAPWNKLTEITPGFNLLKWETDLLTAEFTSSYDLIYFDAFAPDIQPEMWSESLFKKLYNTMSKGGILTTYSAKGVVRRTLQKVGFTVERIPGPPHKREMLRATK